MTDQIQTKPTIKEFARILGVSTATVSRAFSDKGRISDETRLRIRQKAAELGYRANFHARSLSSHAPGSVTLFYPLMNSEEPDYFISEMIFWLTRELHRSGLTLQITPFVSDDEETEFNRCCDHILERRSGGIIVVAGDRHSRGLYQAAVLSGTPVVIIGHMSGVEGNSVRFDNESGAFQAGRYFRQIGCKHPAYVGGYLDRRKKIGFARGLQCELDQIVMLPGGGGFKFGLQAIELLSATYPDVDCVLCANDVLAMGVTKAAIDRGIEVPGQLAVIGFDDIRPARYCVPAISSVSLHLDKIGYSAARMIAQLIKNPRQVIPSEMIECDLVLRQSS